MSKKLIKYCLYGLAVCYLIYAFVVIPQKEDNSKCKGIFVTISSCDDEILSRDNVIELLKKEGLDPNGKVMDSVVCRDIERYINGLSIVEKCEAYKTTTGYVDLSIVCRMPILKVLEPDGDEFYIDSVGNKIEDIHKTLYLPVATGHVDDGMIKKELKEIAKAICGNKFWQAQIEQIYFDEKKNIILVPRVGDHVIEFGTAENAPAKLDKLYTFYKKGLSTVGWNKHSKLNVEFGNKIFATKKDNKQ